jgi:uncharacterized protein (DUF1800 family)
MKYPGYEYPWIFNKSTADSQLLDYQMAAWWRKSLDGKDQLRQRVAYALSQILVVSHIEPPLNQRTEALAHYYDQLAYHAFGNYRDLIEVITLHPAMGVYLSHQGNKKTNIEQGIRPDENFARELMQLFTIGLYEMNLDGSVKRDEQGEPIPTYSQQDVENLAAVLTGLDLLNNNEYGQIHSRQGDYTRPMGFTYLHYETAPKTLFGQQLIEASAYQQPPALAHALDLLFNHPNTPVFVAKNLILRLTSSNPSGDYIQSVAQAFIDNGKGVRGDMKAVIRAILLHAEVRNGARSLSD